MVALITGLCSGRTVWLNFQLNQQLRTQEKNLVLNLKVRMIYDLQRLKCTYSDDLGWPKSHTLTAGLSKCDLSYNDAAIDKISTDIARQ